MASDPRPTRPSELDVGIRTVRIPDEAGRRAREWALALAADAEARGYHEVRDHLSSPWVVLCLQAIIEEARTDFVIDAERVFYQELKNG